MIILPANSVNDNCRRIARALQRFPRSRDALRASAGIYAGLRGGRVIFARHDNMNLIVNSSHGFGPCDQIYFEGPQMGPLLLQVLLERSSLLLQSFDTRKYPDQLPVALHYEGRVEAQTISNWFLEKHSPVALRGRGAGQALVTPLGLDFTAPLAYGLIYEYRPSAFFPHEIAEARAYASVFMAELALRLAAETYQRTGRRPKNIRD
jgi:hypothetical protein